MKSVLFLMVVLVISFCYFVSNLWQYHGLADIIGVVATTAGITLLFSAVHDEEE